jgi:hypothetical protein
MKKFIALSCLTALLLAGCENPENSSSSSKQEETTTAAASEEQTTAADTTAEAETTTAKATVAETTAEATTAAETTTHEANVPAGGRMDMYPAIYQQVIKAQFDKTAEENDGASSIEFAFRDLDADGLPELILKYGTCEADFQTDIYTVDANVEPRNLGTFGGGHTSFCYDENTGKLVFFWAQMGAASIQYLDMAGGTVKITDEDEYIADQVRDYDALLEEKGIKYIRPYVTAYRSGLNGGVVSYFVNENNDWAEKDGLYLDYMG